MRPVIPHDGQIPFCLVDLSKPLKELIPISRGEDVGRPSNMLDFKWFEAVDGNDILLGVWATDASEEQSAEILTVVYAYVLRSRGTRRSFATLLLKAVLPFLRCGYLDQRGGCNRAALFRYLSKLPRTPRISWRPAWLAAARTSDLANASPMLCRLDGRGMLRRASASA